MERVNMSSISDAPMGPNNSPRSKFTTVDSKSKKITIDLEGPTESRTSVAKSDQVGEF